MLGKSFEVSGSIKENSFPLGLLVPFSTAWLTSKKMKNV